MESYESIIQMIHKLLLLVKKYASIWYCLYFRMCKEKKKEVISILMLRQTLTLHDWCKSQLADPLWSKARRSGLATEKYIQIRIS